MMARLKKYSNGLTLIHLGDMLTTTTSTNADARQH